MWHGQEIDAAIIAYTPLVRMIAHSLTRRLPSSVDVNDMIQAGMIGLLEAASRYDADAGIQFRSFANARIYGAMLDELRTLDWMPRTTRKAQREITLAASALQNRIGRRARQSEIAVELGISVMALNEILLDVDMVALEEGEDAASLTPDPSVDLEGKQFDAALALAIVGLTPRKREVIELYYREGMLYGEIAERTGVSESRVCQIHREAVDRLRQGLREHL